MIHAEERETVRRAAVRMFDAGLVVGSAGNVSVKVAPGRFAITPSSIAYGSLRVDDVVVVDDEGDLLDDEEDFGRAPSFETPTHLAIYAARPDVGAIVHTHSPMATAMALARRPIPPVLDEMVVYLGGAVEVAAHAMSGSDELARNVVAALGPRSAVLLAAHGVITTGADLDKAYRNATLVEHVARVLITAERLGEVPPLPDEVIEAERQMYDIVKAM